jgi:hypothetical protein
MNWCDKRHIKRGKGLHSIYLCLRHKALIDREDWTMYLRVWTAQTFVNSKEFNSIELIHETIYSLFKNFGQESYGSRPVWDSTLT